MTAASEGDRSAWDSLVERFTPLLWATARGHRLADADAADVVQTTWLRLVEHLDDLRDPDRVGAWLATTARRESLRVISSGARVMPTDDVSEIVEPVAGPEDHVVRRDRDAVLRTALSRLGDKCRLLLRVLAADPAPSYEDVSDALEMPIGSIGPTRARCLERLRAEMMDLGIRSAS